MKLAKNLFGGKQFVTNALVIEARHRVPRTARPEGNALKKK